MEIEENNNNLFLSLFLVEQINIFRKTEGNKSQIKHSDFLCKIEDEFLQEIIESKIAIINYRDKKGKVRKMYELDFEQSVQLLNSESERARKLIIEILIEMQKPFSGTFTNNPFK